MFTKQQRHEVYKDALGRIGSGEEDFMCVALKWAMQTHCGITYETGYKILEGLPEFIKYKPEGVSIGNCWFSDETSIADDKRERIRILRECLQEVE